MRPPSRKTRDANYRMPEGLTETLSLKISELRPSTKVDYLREEIFSKYVSPDTDPPLTRRIRAINKWLGTEQQNESTSDRLLTTPLDFQICPRVPFGEFVLFCQDLIAEIIGDTVPLNALIGSFSGGASTSRARTSSQPDKKYLGLAHVTPQLREHFEEVILPEMPLWQQYWDKVLVTEVPGNVMFTVPKKTDIDRVACKEPDINMFVQKGLGREIRNRLQSVGINLNDQSKNRSLARQGSITGALATLDLSSASDSVTDTLVSLLMPPCWYTWMNCSRSHVTEYSFGNDVHEHRNHMFSSMGNGFTFELESLLFYALMKTTAYFTGTRGVISVYGDDIIIPTEMASHAIYVLGYFGFEVNPKKSHTTGFFRESCGGHYSHGDDITPFYVKEPLNRLSDVIHVANRLREWSRDPVADTLGVLDPEAEPIWLWLKSFVPSYLWGGVDTSFKYQLVSDDQPVKRLQSVTRKRETGLGGYLHWHNATWARDAISDGLETSTSSSTEECCRLRPALVSTVSSIAYHWPHEVMGETPSIYTGDRVSL